MGSTRLPGKILKQFYGNKTLLETILENLHNIKQAKIIVATSENTNDDALEKFLKEKNEIVYRGSEKDVLERFIKAAEANAVDGIIRICSDNPFLDWHGVAQLIETGRTSNADYVGFRINNKPSILTHFGFWGEFVTLKALKKVYMTTAAETPAHEHVTFHVYKNPSEYNCEWIDSPDFLQGRDDIRLTIDTPEDMQNAINVYSDLKKHKPDFTIRDVVNYIDSHEEIKKSMLKNIIQNQK